MKKGEEKIRKLKASLVNISLILSIFSVMSLVLITMIPPTASATTWHVYPGPGTPIQNAIDDASDGDTILVHAGLYNETILVDKTLSIIGDSKTNTTIDAKGAGTVIKVYASWVNITGFTIKNGGGGGFPNGIGIWLRKQSGMNIDSHDANIYDCNLTNNEFGLYIQSDNHSIYNCNIENNGDDGIFIKPGSNININGNTLLDNAWSGISMDSSINITISNNTISSANASIISHLSEGIYLRSSNNIHIENNTIYDNNGSCINLTLSDNNFIYENPLLSSSIIGIYLKSSNGNNINNSSIANNTYGIKLYNSNRNNINNSSITNNTYGIELDDSNENNITLNNKIFNNTIYGIYSNGSSGSHENKIISNNISYNNGIAVYLSNSNNNIICDNEILFNEEYGISLEDSKDNYICNNTVNNNTAFGLYIDGDYRNNITENNTFNGGSIIYFYGINGSSDPLNATVENKTLTTGENVTNIGKITFVECSDFFVSNNTISNATKGIFLYNSNNITLDNNTIYDDIDEYGLYIEGDYRNYITQNNTVNGETIYYYYNENGTKDNPIIVEIKQILDEPNVSNVGKITIVDCSYLLLKDNIVSNNDYGIFLYGSDNIIMWNNSMSSPNLVGLFIEEGFHHYIFQNNSANGETIYYFTDLNGTENDPMVIDYFKDLTNATNSRVSNVGLITYANCSYLDIRNNTLERNFGSGIFIVDSFNITVKNNTARHNCDGMLLLSSSNVTITENVFSYNHREDGYGEEAGIHLKNNKEINYIINNSDISRNGRSGIYLEYSENDVITGHNYTINQYHWEGYKTTFINIYHSSPHIHNNIFDGKDFPEQANMIRGSYCSPKIEDNYFFNGSRAILGFSHTNNSAEIIDNHFEHFSGLAAIYLKNDSSPWISNNTITDVVKGDGIDIYHHDSSPDVYNNTIYDIAHVGIQLEDSNATLENNEIYDAHCGINVAWNPYDKGEHTRSNTTIIGNTIYNCMKPKPPAASSTSFNSGIFFSTYSTGKILNNDIYGCKYGIYADYTTTSAEIAGNNCSNNINGGIRIRGDEDIQGAHQNLKVQYNTIIGVSEGIYVEGVDCSPIIDHNTVLDNTKGIQVCEHSSPIITNNTIESNGYGIYVVEGASPTIRQNDINWSTLYSIKALDSSPTVEWNTFRNKEYRTGGITSYFHTCSSPTNITNNTYINSHRAVYLMYTPALVRDNNITLVDGFTNGLYADDTVGIAVYHQSHATVINNTISGGDRGIGVEYDSNAIVMDNTITDAEYKGIFCRELTSSIMSNNSVTNSSYGIRLYYSSGVNITYSTMIESGIFIEGDLLEHWDSHNIDSTNTANGKPVYYRKNQTGVVIPSGAGQVILANCTNVTIENQDLNNCSVGIAVGFSSNINISGINASNNYYSIYLYNSTVVNVTGTNMSEDGIFIEGDLLEHWNTHNIDNTTNTVNGKPVYYWKNQIGGVIPAGAGEVILANCTNVKVENQELTHGSVGIELGFCSNNNITGNNASNNTVHGIYLSNSDENTIMGNNITSNIFGIHLYYSDRNNITGNNVFLNHTCGMYLYYSNWNNITGNNVSLNVYGIYLHNSNGNNITGNNVTNNYYGIYLDPSNLNNITGNTFSSNTYGIYLYYSNGNNITGNTIYSNNCGIYLYHSNGNNITGNNASSNNDYGIYIQSSSNVTITSNNILNNDYGVYLYHSDWNNIIGNNASSNYNHGIYLDSSSNVTITNNSVSSNLHGIYLYYSDWNNIISNNVSSNYYGIYLYYSNWNNIIGNNVSSNNYNIYLYYSSKNNITSNNASNGDWGIFLSLTTLSKIGINYFSSNLFGVYLSYSDHNEITNNDVLNSTNHGIYLTSSCNNSIIDNDLYNNSVGIEIYGTSQNNSIYHNNLNNTNTNAFDYGSYNKWDNGLEGNWWSDNPNTTDANNDGICDVPYVGNYFIDNYPLVNEINDRIWYDDPYFWFIQSAINFAEEDNTIYVDDDDYYETVNVSKDLTIIGDMIILRGDMTILINSILTLQDTHLVMNCSNDGEYTIIVDGTLQLINSTISSFYPQYRFKILGNGDIIIKNSDIRNVHPDSTFGIGEDSIWYGSPLILFNELNLQFQIGGGCEITYLRLPKTADILYARLDLTGNISGSNYPTNVTMDVGDDCTAEWSYSGELTSTATISDLNTSTIFTISVQDYLDTNQPEDINGYIYIPVSFSSESEGKLVVSNIDMRYMYRWTQGEFSKDHSNPGCYYYKFVADIYYTGSGGIEINNSSCPNIDYSITIADQNWSKPATIKHYYYDENNDGIIDNTTIPEFTLKMYWWDEDNETWVPASVVFGEENIGVNIVDNYIWANVNHVSSFTANGSYVPIAEIKDLIGNLDGMDIEQGIKNSLKAKLEATLGHLNATQDHFITGDLACGNANLTLAKNKLNAFINQVEAQRGKKISEEDADILINDAQEIIDLTDKAYA